MVNKENLIDDCLQRICAAQHATGDSEVVVAVYDQLMSKMLKTFEYASASERQAIRLKIRARAPGSCWGLQKALQHSQSESITHSDSESDWLPYWSRTLRSGQKTGR